MNTWDVEPLSELDEVVYKLADALMKKNYSIEQIAEAYEKAAQEMVGWL